MIAEAAFYIWQEEGQPDGRADAHWTQAIERLKSAQPTPKARKAPAKKAAAKPKVASTKAKAPATRKKAASKSKAEATAN
ncbi:DUF2934 domain-containing protein [Primorskyibacter sp. S187A]|uniref:DUF2934 domain-containing protein n=1 Tax=Primorskyibacter sp. S187A TaxID=3415130 RepID=UPI003C7C463B